MNRRTQADPVSGASRDERRRHRLHRLANVGAVAGAVVALLYALDWLGVDIGPLSTTHSFGPSLFGCILLSLSLLLRAVMVAPGARFFAVAGALGLLITSPVWLSALLEIGVMLLW